MSTRYIVEIDLRTMGSTDFGAKSIERATVGASKFQSYLSKAGDAALGLHGKLMGVADRVAGVAMGMAKWGAIAAGAAGIGAVTFGVMGLNNQLEKTTISLGAIFQAQGISNNLPAGLQLAESTIAKMRVDAAKLPGEFTDLVNIFTTGSIPAFRSGSSVKGFADLSAKAMAAGVVASMPLDQVAREFAMLLEGRSGAHNVFGMRLLGLAGDAAEEFNKKAAPERFAIISKELDKYGDAMGAFGESFEGKFSTAVDGAKNLVRIGTAPLFERAKDALGDINEWLGSPKALAQAEAVGVFLADAFDWARERIELWWPSIEKFGLNAYTKLSEIWVEVQPYVEKFGDSLQRALEDPGTIDKLITLLKLYVAAKVGGEGISIGAGIVGTGANLALAARAGGLFGTGAAATGAGAAAGTAGAGAAAAGGAGAAAAGGGVAALGTAAGVAAAALVGVAAFGWQANELRKDIASGMSWDPNKADWRFDGVSEERRSGVRNWKIPDWMGGGVWANSEDRAAIVEWANKEAEAHYATTEGMEHMRERLVELQTEARATTSPLADLRVELYEQAIATADTRRSFEGITETADDMIAALGGVSGAIGGMFSEDGFSVKRFHNREEVGGSGGAGKPSRHGGGGGGTTIQKVEIVVTSNQDPSRIARATVDELGKLASYRSASRYVPNYSQAPR